MQLPEWTVLTSAWSKMLSARQAEYLHRIHPSQVSGGIASSHQPTTDFLVRAATDYVFMPNITLKLTFGAVSNGTETTITAVKAKRTGYKLINFIGREVGNQKIKLELSLLSI